MGLLVVGGAAVLVLSLLTLVTVALVQLVLFLTVRNSLMVVALSGVYWFVASRRRQVAKGFYSCTQAPILTEETTPRQTRSTTSTAKSAALVTMAAQEEEEKCNDGADLRPLPPLETVPETAVTTHPDAANEADERRSVASSASETESCSDDAPVAALASSASDLPLRAVSSMRLPDLRHRKWKHPSRSLPLGLAKKESLLQETRKSSPSGSAIGSSTNSPRRPELYSSPRSIAMEQRLMKTALEADGYWIGDFRVPPPARATRSSSTGASTSTKSTSTMSSKSSSLSSFRSTGARIE